MLRIAFRILALFLVLLVVLIGSLFLISGERLAKIAGDQLTNTLGREVRISDDLRPQLFPNIGVRTGSFSISDDAGENTVVAGDGLSVGVDLLALLSRRVEVKEITLVSPKLVLVKASDGTTNWGSQADKDKEASSNASSEPLSDFSLSSLSIQNGTVSYRDESSDLDVLIEEIDLTAAAPSATAPLTADVKFITNGQAASGQVELASLSSFLAGDATEVLLDASIGENIFRFAGGMSSAGAIDGDIDVKLPDPDALMALTGGEGTALPAELLPIETSGVLSVTSDAVRISNGAYRLGVNRLQGDLNVALEDVPFVGAQLRGGALDLSFLSAEEGSANAEPPPAKGVGWSKDPIDASGLSLIDADIRLDAKSIDLGTTAMQNVVATVTVDNARAVARVLKAQAFGGALAGQFVVNNRNGLSVAGEMDGKTVAVQSLLTDMAGFDRMRGAGNTQLSFLGVGENMDQIMRSLSGNAALDIGKGDITGFDLASLFGGNDAAEAVGDKATTIFQSLEASFVISEGVMRNDDLLISANLFEATGLGDIDLGRQRIDYTMRPRVFENDLTGGLSVPVKIEGPWSSLRIYPDLEALARERLEMEEEKLRAEAEARLEAERQKVEESANRRLEKEKQKLEDRLENELRKGLGSLFD